MILLALGLALPLQFPAPAIPQDSIDRLRRDARRAEAEFERLSRRLVPVRHGSSGSRCDEVVGRFCLIYDSGRPPEPDPEHGRVIDARRTAIEKLRAAFTWLPADFATAAPLVRYLVEDDRPSEAVSTARMYSIVSADSVWGPLLSAFAEHSAGQDSAAERLITEVLPRLPAEDRARIQDLNWVLEADDRSAYARLDSADRRDFERRFWTMADPLFLTPGNESWTEHVGRHIWSRVLARAPVVAGMVRWGSDLEQLTVRYGVPVARTRTPGTVSAEGSLIEHYDPDQLAFAPADLLTRGPPPPPLPGQQWELGRVRSRTGFAPATVRRTIPMDHQVTRFPGDDGITLRLDAVFPMDSAAAGAPYVLAGLWVLDADLNLSSHEHGRQPVIHHTATFWFEAALPDAAYVYSIEALEPHSRLAARSRYAIEPDTSTASIRLSDPLISFPWGSRPPPTHRQHPSLRPRANLVLASTDTVGLYAEARGLPPAGTYQVRLSLEPASRASLPSRVVTWLGSRLGISSPRRPVRLEWTDTADPNGLATLAVELRPGPDDHGDFVLAIRLTSLSTHDTRETRRILRFNR